MDNPFADLGAITVQFSHVAYRFGPGFAERRTGIGHYQTWNREETRARLPEADVLVVSGFWNDALLEAADRLRFIQSIGAGYDQFPLDELRRRGIRLASARGANSKAVSEHAMAMILALARQLHTGRDHQAKHAWRGMISDSAQREDELGGKTLLIIGLGAIGSRLARMARAFDMRVLGVKRNLNVADSAADEVHALDKVDQLLPRADFVVLTCPFTPETADIINARALSRMKPSACLVNVARGGCVDEPALLQALRSGGIAGAALDSFKAEPLPADSPFWDLENVILTPHTAGETRRYEENVIDILLENLGRLSRGEADLVNQIV
ncbi:MAG: D-2-hydroxyacid dehydrogenase [Verrucomicrobia bacterium]|nr:D-2-hydroxyacid dehydrogenase [Verrucomicrobiota bacterium]